MKLEKMADFFAERADIYDRHMLTEVEGCKEGYKKMASLIPDSTRKLLDLVRVLIRALLNTSKPGTDIIYSVAQVIFELKTVYNGGIHNVKHYRRFILRKP